MVQQGLEVMDLIEQGSIDQNATGMAPSLFDMSESSGPQDQGDAWKPYA